MSFGKRAQGIPAPITKPVASVPEPAAPPPEKESVPEPKKSKPAAKPAQVKPPAPATPPPAMPALNQSEEYYETKTTVFNALIDTIDLGQLAQLDQESAREEIRDIVVEIIAIKNVVMSISEQESLLDDICNDVLGYGPL
ncbi:MAG: CpaF family protein, partial [Pseudomonadota bacterium]